MPAPLCVFHSNCLHCQDMTKQISLEREGKDVSLTRGDNDCFRPLTKDLLYISNSQIIDRFESLFQNNELTTSFLNPTKMEITLHKSILIDHIELPQAKCGYTSISLKDYNLFFVVFSCPQNCSWLFSFNE